MSVPPFKIAGLDHLLVLVEGMPEALRFYQGVLGCTVEARLPRYGMVELRAGVSQIDLVDVGATEGAWGRSPGRGRNVDHFALALAESNEQSLREHLADCGIAIIEERIEQESLSLYVSDPSGNKIELICRR